MWGEERRPQSHSPLPRRPHEHRPPGCRRGCPCGGPRRGQHPPRTTHPCLRGPSCVWTDTRPHAAHACACTGPTHTQAHGARPWTRAAPTPSRQGTGPLCCGGPGVGAGGGRGCPLPRQACCDKGSSGPVILLSWTWVILSRRLQVIAISIAEGPHLLDGPGLRAPRPQEAPLGSPGDVDHSVRQAACSRCGAGTAGEGARRSGPGRPELHPGLPYQPAETQRPVARSPVGGPRCPHSRF